MAGLVLVVLIAGLLTSVVAARVRARARADWLQGQNLTMAPVVKGLKEPTFVAFPPDGSKRMFILERDGPIRIADGDGHLRSTPLLDLTGQVSTSTEQGMFSLAFHPRFADNGLIYVAYTAMDNSYQLVRYTTAGDEVDPSSASTVLSLAKKTRYHNGGMLAFGTDGYLYVAVGDDEDSVLAQSLDSLFGKILRLDVDAAEPYAIPESNPFVQTPGAQGEIWSYGLRNPWRFSFDRMTGDMWLADVGDARWEEVDFQAANSGGGENYGYPMNEGSECMQPERCQVEGLVAPVVTYGHDMLCSVTGGYVYRGRDVGGLTGGYIFGDLCTGGIFGVRPGTTTRLELSFSPIKISSFGEDQSGELYVVDIQGGVVYRIVEGALP
jgi:glucose/arabinose dehydrogenase